MEYDCDSESFSLADIVSRNTDLYYLEKINNFLEDIYGRSANVNDYFPDGRKFIWRVNTLQKLLGLDLLDEKKCYC